MEKRTLMTKLDGYQPFWFYEKDDFKGRVTKFYTGNSSDDMKLEKEMPIPDDSIICDYCDDAITEFPVPVFHGHALCPKCYKQVIT